MPKIGTAFNNNAQYYYYYYYYNPYYNKVSNNYVLPISIKYIHNSARENTESRGKNFLVATLSLAL